MRSYLFILFSCFCLCAQSQETRTPDKIYGKLFEDVQLNAVFHDSKTFVDCIPKSSPEEILERYFHQKIDPSNKVSMRAFLEENFFIPGDTIISFASSKNIVQHINFLWTILKRDKDPLQEGSSLLPLPHSYIVPGGRFREVYYWDSYFTMLGLKESGEVETIENMINNFSWLIQKFGHIPNGNRTYYLTRSQPPFFSLMVDLLAEISNKDSVRNKYSEALKSEWEYWNSKNKAVDFKDPDTGEFLRYYRYWDEDSIPRQESYLEDVETVNRAIELALNENPHFNFDSLRYGKYRHLRSAAESGWDFSSRWFKKNDDLSSIHTTDVLPVDLNALLQHLALANGYSTLSKKMFRERFYNEKIGWYCDFDLEKNEVRNIPTLAGMFPLFLKLADEEDAERIVQFLKDNFLKEGGVVTSLNYTGEQWDAPNGWAPLQWITIVGLENYGYHELAKEIAGRWFELNKKVFLETGKLMEKYNVENTNLKAGGGEYPSQDGFGWTNGVLLAVMNKYGFN